MLDAKLQMQVPPWSGPNLTPTPAAVTLAQPAFFDMPPLRALGRHRPDSGLVTGRLRDAVSSTVGHLGQCRDTRLLGSDDVHRVLLPRLVYTNILCWPNHWYPAFAKA